MSTREEREHWRAKGAHMTLGVIVCLGLFLIFGDVVQWAMNKLDVGVSGFDSTDSPEGERSGMSLKTDHGTGCQYLQTTWGGITPRMGPDGKQVCTPPHP